MFPSIFDEHNQLLNSIPSIRVCVCPICCFRSDFINCIHVRCVFFCLLAISIRLSTFCVYLVDRLNVARRRGHIENLETKDYRSPDDAHVY